MIINNNNKFRASSERTIAERHQLTDAMLVNWTTSVDGGLLVSGDNGIIGPDV